jgi:FHA domain
LLLLLLLLLQSFTVILEPTEDWTVDQVMNWWLLHSKSETDATRDELIAKLQTQLEDGIERLWHDHEQVKQVLLGKNTMDENQDPQLTTGENQPTEGLLKEGSEGTRPSGGQAAATTTTSSSSNNSSSTSIRLVVEIVGGDYVGKVFELDQLAHEPAIVGRSRGKKVLKHGISLPKDPEVSTTHGKFLAKTGGRVFYVDDGSTNGSMINRQLIQSHVEIPLESGMEIQVGGTLLLVTF